MGLPDGEHPVRPRDLPAQQERRQHAVHELERVRPGRRVVVVRVEEGVHALVAPDLDVPPQHADDLDGAQAAAHHQVDGDFGLFGTLAEVLDAAGHHPHGDGHADAYKDGHANCNKEDKYWLL